MKRTLLACLLGAAVFLSAPIAASAQTSQETLRITAATATTDQASDPIDKPLWVRGIFVVIDVTAGSTLLLDVNLEVYSPTGDEWLPWSANCPSGGGITAQSTTGCLFSPVGVSTSGHYDTNDKLVGLPGTFRILVDHGNSNEATYTVYSQWLTQ